MCRERTVEGFNQRHCDSILGRGRPHLRHRRDISESYFAISYLSVTACAFNSPDTALACISHTCTEASPCLCPIYPQLPPEHPQITRIRHAVCSETPADPVRQGVRGPHCQGGGRWHSSALHWYVACSPAFVKISLTARRQASCSRGDITSKATIGTRTAQRNS
jgi:hypothetical protein